MATRDRRCVARLHDPHERDAKRPRPINKRVWASIGHGAQRVVDDAFAEALRRDPQRARRWVVLVDGQRDQIQRSQAVEVREHVFMTATSSVTYDYFSPPVWYTTRDGDEIEHTPVGMLMDRFTATGGPGLLMIHAHGNAFVRNLAPGESVLIKGPRFCTWTSRSR